MKCIHCCFLEAKLLLKAVEQIGPFSFWSFGNCATGTELTTITPTPAEKAGMWGVLLNVQGQMAANKVWHCKGGLGCSAPCNYLLSVERGGTFCTT